MVTVLPGRPQPGLQSLASGYWKNYRYNAYISGNAFVIIRGSQTIVQTVYDHENRQLVAIALDESSGKIATCTDKEARVYRPVEHVNSIKWIEQSRFDIPCPSSDITCCLSWGTSEELLVASHTLSLFSTSSKPSCSWDKALPCPAAAASISPDSSYIVSISQFDCLPKVWRRLTYGAGEVRFDVAYLQHPNVVTSARWRRPVHPESPSHQVLYTVCLDNMVRIWSSFETSDSRHWQILGTIDIHATLNDEVTLGFVCFLDGRESTASAKRGLADKKSSNNIALDHIAIVSNTNPEICMFISGSGRITAWALESPGPAANGSRSVYSVAMVKSKQIGDFCKVLTLHDTAQAQVRSYCDEETGKLHLLLHAFDGRIAVYGSNIAEFFDPHHNESRLSLLALWSGHSQPVEKIVRNFTGRTVVSRTSNGECAVWRHSHSKSHNSGVALVRQSVITSTRPIRRICVLHNGNLVVLLSDNGVSLWDCRLETAILKAQCPAQSESAFLCLSELRRPDANDISTFYVAVVASDRRGLVWKIELADFQVNNPNWEGVAAMSEYCRFELGVAADFKYVLPVDPAGSSPVMPNFLDVFARDVAISYTHTGRVDFWTARVESMHQSVDWLSTCFTETGISDAALASGSKLKKAALVNSVRSQVTIWDIGSSRLEFQEDYGLTSSIQDLDWTSTPDSQSILAVGFKRHVVLLSQMRFDYLNKGPAWAPIRDIGIHALTPHPIGDSAWLGDGHLVVGAGNQLFVFDRYAGSGESLLADVRLTNRKDETWDLFEAVQKSNGPIPIFHPQFLSQCILAGKRSLVRRILVALHETLKYLVPGDSVDDYLGLDLENFYTTFVKQDKAVATSLNDEHSNEQHDENFLEQMAVSINYKLMRIDIPQLSGHEQIQLADMVECVAVVEKHQRSMDENGARFMLFCRQNALRKRRSNEIHLSWREVNWAYHSSSQDLLVQFVSHQAHGAMLWEHARETGLFMWLADMNAVRSQFEAVARNIYTRGNVKNPVDCSLFYMALRKKTLLQGLWRAAKGNREQGATQRLLANDFENPKWRRAALKNAYALLSKRRFEYAAAFFLLADHLEDAVEVCVRHLHDIQLAITVARVYEGDDSPVLQKILRDEMLPLAAREGNRWLASWAFYMLGRRDMAVRALVMPVYTLVKTPSPDIKSRLYLTDDPALVILYSQLRQQTLQSLRGASRVTPKLEYEFVLHSAKLYDRMGCDLIGLDLVRNWEFQQPMAVITLGGETNPPKLPCMRSSIAFDNVQPIQRDLEIHVAKNRLEPTASLLSSPNFEESNIIALFNSSSL